jgi:hypothetical protein
MNQIADVTPIAGYRMLKNLNLAGNPINPDSSLPAVVEGGKMILPENLNSRVTKTD